MLEPTPAFFKGDNHIAENDRRNAEVDIEGLKFSSPDNSGHILQKDGHPQNTDDDGESEGIAQRSIGDSLNTDPQNGTQINGVDHLLPKHSDTLPEKIIMWEMI